MPRSARMKRQGRSSVISKLSTAQLIAEIKQRRETISRQLQFINAELTELGSIDRPMIMSTPTNGTRRTASRGRGGNEQSLPALLHSLLNGRTMSVQEMTEAAVKAGHKSKSKNFRTLVSLALLNNRERFKRVGRGQYTAM